MPNLRELNTGELLVVASLRLYAMPFRDPSRDHPDWRAGFVAAGIGPIAVPAFGALFRIVSRTNLYPLDIGCPHCRDLRRDEAKLLRLIALHHHGRQPEAATILREWLPSSAARMAAMPALGLAFALERGGMVLPLRETPPFHAPVSDRGLALVH
jgi:hypothetical protein